MNLDDRMKSYEMTSRYIIMPRMPTIIRVDGKAFHSLTKTCKRPFDDHFMVAMNCAALALVQEIQNARIAFVQSDEISILLIDYNKYNSQQWFDGNINKIVSISACIAAQHFSKSFGKISYFDSRVFNLPEKEVENYFIWRQQDASRNSVNMVAQSLYSPKQLHGVNTKDAQELIFQKGQNWNDLGARYKRGRCALPDGMDYEVPIFTQDREYIRKHLTTEDL